MNPDLHQGLHRTLLLIRDEVAPHADDATLLSALTSTSIVLAGDARTLASHAAQSAFITAALLMARSGHSVHLLAPDVRLVGAQPPLRGTHLITALLEVGLEVLPSVALSVYPPRRPAALEVLFGDTPPRVRAQRQIALNASAWSARISTPDRAHAWIKSGWPCGALAAGALAAAEAFKAAMHRLRPWARHQSRFDELFRFVENVALELAPPETRYISHLGPFDCVSGGAITNSTLYLLSRIPGISGSGRLIEPEVGDISNLNRYALMLLSDVDQLKAQVLKSRMPPGLELHAIAQRYEGGQLKALGEFASHVLVGVDDIPTRWRVQAEQPAWLAIGATTHWDSMASFHRAGLACARCLHPRDDPATAPIPTVAFVSFFAGLVAGTYFLRALSGEQIPADEQCTYFSALRPEHIWRSPIAPRMTCAMCSSSSGAQAA